MNPEIIIQLALATLGQVLSLIAEVKGQVGMSDDAILAAAQQATAGNDAAYAQLVAALKGSVVSQ